jgi:cell division protein FtsQ
MRRKRKKSRLRIKWKPTLWVLTLVTIAAGICFSPITAVRKVRIDGALLPDHDRLEALAKELEGVPCVRIDPRDIESKVLALPEMRTAELSRTPFGSAVLTVRYRVPVARLMGSPDMMLDAEGVLYPSMAPQQGLPVIQLPRGGPPTLATLAANWEPLGFANLATIARTLRPSGVIRIQMSESGVVSLNLDSDRVILGSLEDLDKKIGVLKERMASYPNELSENEALNLTNPDFPSLVQRGH